MQDYTAYCNFVLQGFYAWLAKEFPDVKTLRDRGAALQLYKELCEKK